MPKEITHLKLAEKIYLNINSRSKLKNVIKKYKNLFFTGAIALDSPYFLIFDKHSKMMTHLARDMHDDRENTCKPMVRVIEKYNRDVPDFVLAFLLGVITHVYVDGLFHPFIYYFSCMDNTRHRTIETYLDFNYWEDPRWRGHEKRIVSEVFSSIEIEKEKLYEILSLLYNVKGNNNINFIRKIFKCHVYLCGLLHNNTARIIFKILNLVPGIHLEEYIALFYPPPWQKKGPVFSGPIVYTHPVTGKEYRYSVKEIEEKVIKDVLEVYKLIEKHWNRDSPVGLFSRIKCPNLCTGIAHRGIKDMKYFNTEKDLMDLIFQDAHK